MKKLKEAHKWLSSKEGPPSGYSDDDLAEMGFQKGYNLTAWTETPGEVDSTMLKQILITTLTGGRMGLVSGPGPLFEKEAELVKGALM